MGATGLLSPPPPPPDRTIASCCLQATAGPRAATPTTPPPGCSLCGHDTLFPFPFLGDDWKASSALNTLLHPGEALTPPSWASRRRRGIQRDGSSLRPLEPQRNLSVLPRIALGFSAPDSLSCPVVSSCPLVGLGALPRLVVPPCSARPAIQRVVTWSPCWPCLENRRIALLGPRSFGIVWIEVSFCAAPTGAIQGNRGVTETDGIPANAFGYGDCCELRQICRSPLPVSPVQPCRCHISSSASLATPFKRSSTTPLLSLPCPGLASVATARLNGAPTSDASRASSHSAAGATWHLPTSTWCGKSKGAGLHLESAKGVSILVRWRSVGVCLIVIQIRERRRMCVASRLCQLKDSHRDNRKLFTLAWYRPWTSHGAAPRLALKSLSRAAFSSA